MSKRANTSENGLTHQEIAAVAYSIFEQNGQIPGRDVENWLQAEAQLREERKRTPQTASPSRGGAKAATRPLLAHST